MEIRREDIKKNPINGKFFGSVCVNIEEFNPMIVKAKMKFVADSMDNILKIVEAHEAEFREIYGDLVIKIAYRVPDNYKDIKPNAYTRKYVQSREIQNNLLNAAFEG